MKISPPAVKPRTLKWLICGGGILGLLLRLLLAATAIDAKGLLISGHPTWVGLWILTAAVALVLLAGTRAIRGPADYRDSFPGSPVSALGCILAAVNPLRTAMDQFGSGDRFLALVSALAVLSLILTALCRLLEKKPSFLFHVVVCLYFALEMMALYRTWSFDPQLQDYCFQLFACIALTMTAYQLAVFDVGRGSHRALWIWGLVAVYLCAASLDSGLFYAAGGVWALTNLSNLRRPRQHKQTETEQLTNNES